MIMWVIDMHEYKKVRRLQSEEFIGTGHIAVQEHTASSYPQHWHDYFEIELILEGTGRHIYNGSEHTIGKGSAYILTPVDFHGLEAAEPVRLINISFDDVCLPERMLTFLSDPDTVKNCKFTEEEFERSTMAAELLRHECETGGPCVGQLLEYLLSCFARKDPHRVPDAVKNEHLTGIKKAISYIEMHFRENISLEQLAALSGYNPTYFSELFRKVTGETYKGRLKSLRVGYARMLLANGISVTDACFASGFGSLSNFLAAFKEKCGMTPSEYRQNCKKAY